MTVLLAKLDKAALQKIPSHERSLFLSLAHLANEINALQKLVVWSTTFATENNTEFSGQVSLMLMFLKLLAGKLKEGHRLLQRRFYGTGISHDYESSLAPEVRDALTEIKRYFSQSNTINLVRNNYAFHYSPDEVDATLSSVPEELEIYLETEGSANNLYYFAEVLANRALLRSMRFEDEQAAFEHLMEEITKVAHWFTIVCDSLMTEFLKRYSNGLWEGTAVEVTFDYLPPFRSIRVPWFTDISNLDLASP